MESLKAQRQSDADRQNYVVLQESVAKLERQAGVRLMSSPSVQVKEQDRSLQAERDKNSLLDH